MNTIERVFDNDAEAWAYAYAYGVPSVKEHHSARGVVYIVTRRVIAQALL